MASPVATAKVRLVCSVCGQPLSYYAYSPESNHASWVLSVTALDHLDTHDA